MTPGIIILLIIIGVITIAAGIATIVLYRQGRNKVSVVVEKDRSSNIFWLYRIFVNTPGLKNFFNKYRRRLALLYPADSRDINRKATEMMGKAMIGGIIVVIAIIVLAQGDLFYTLLSLTTAWMVFSNSASTAVDKLETKLLSQFADFITDVRGNYHMTGMVDDAIFMALEHQPYEIGLHGNKIYQIVTSTDVATESERYADSAPNRFFQIFVAICATIQEYGDKKLENGESLFLKNLNYLKEEIYVEVTKRNRMKFVFNGLIFTVALPIFGMKGIERWATSISELSSFYEGSFGFVMTVAIFLSTVICYTLIINLRDGAAKEIKSHALMERLASTPGLAGVLSKICDHNRSKTIRIHDQLKMTGDRITPQAYLLQRIMVAVALGLVSLVLTISTYSIARSKALNDFSNSFNNSIVDDDSYREEMRELGKSYLKANKHLKNYPENIEILSEQIEEEQAVSPAIANEIATEVGNKAETYQNTYYNWWYLLIIIACAACGYYAPIWLLKYRISIMQMSMADEVAQFQTLAMILMNVDGMTLDVILEWMEKFAYAFRESISECIINLESSEKKALMNMRNAETYPAFLRFCDNLMNVDEVGVINAFDEVKTERENYKQQRDLNNEIQMSKKSRLAKDISYIPMGLTIIGYMILPFIMMAFSMMQSMSTALSL